MIRFGENPELVYISAANSDDSLPWNFYTSRENQILKDTMQFPGKSKFPEIIRFRFCGTALSATRSYTMIGFQELSDSQRQSDLYRRSSSLKETIKFP